MRAEPGGRPRRTGCWLGTGTPGTALLTPRDRVGRRELLVFDNRAALSEAAAREVARSMRNALARRGLSTLVLAGGGTPRRLYERLAQEPYRQRIDWPKVALFWGDERCVPPAHPTSNYRMAADTLLSGIPEVGSVHRILGELDPGRAAALYEKEIRKLGGETVPRFDLVLLGMGADGHTASLFPDTPELLEERRAVVATTAPEPPRERVTITLPVINAARKVMFLVTDGEKAATLARVMAGPARVIKGDSAAAPLPAALVRPRRGRLLWLLDRAAAAELKV